MLYVTVPWLGHFGIDTYAELVRYSGFEMVPVICLARFWFLLDTHAHTHTLQ